MKKTTFVAIGTVLVLVGIAAIIYSVPVYENKIMWESSIGRLVETPFQGAKRVVIPIHIGSYQPYAIPGAIGLLLGGIILVSAKATQLEH